MNSFFTNPMRVMSYWSEVRDFKYPGYPFKLADARNN